MAEDRMLSDEILLGLIKANGGGGGTSDYSQLSNKPQINSVVLTGNKSLHELGIASETALATKQDTLTFDAEPTEDSANPVTSGGVYDALGDKADQGEVDDITENTESETATVTGNPITLSDALATDAISVVAEIEPEQDLHGYDKPWAAGAGKNKLPMVLADIKSYNTTGTWNDNVYTLGSLTVTVYTDSDDNITSIKVNGTNGSDNASFRISPACSDFLEIGTQYTVNGCTNGSENTVYLDVLYYAAQKTSAVTFTYDGTHNDSYVRIFVKANATIDNMIIYPMIRLASVTDATFEPYTNICPISGMDSVNVTRTGKNFFADLTKDTSKGYIDNYYLASNGSTAQSGGYYVSEYLEIKPNTAYYIGGILGNAPALCYYDGNKTYISGVQYANQESITDTSPSNAKYMRLSVLKENESLYMVRYVSAIATTSLGTTIYGGSVDLTEGSGSVDKGYKVFDGTNASFTFIDVLDGYGRFTHDISGGKRFDQVDELMSSYLPTISNRTGEWTSPTKSQLLVAFSSVAGRFGLTLYGIKSTADLNTYLASNPLQVVYELATPTTLSLTPATLAMLDGENTVSTDAEEVSVEYIKNTLAGRVKHLEDESGVIDYSTTEQKTGQKWIDGKEIYTITVVLQSAITINQGQWGATSLSAADIGTITSVFTKSGKFVFGGIGASIADGYVNLMNNSASSMSIDTFTIWYTKTT